MGRREITALAAATALAGLGATLGACTPTVRVEVPDKPIEINLNVNIRQEVVVKLERDVQETLRQNTDIF
ncbi:MAG: YnbE family lipoprotein [Hyphomonadaceae bacterium]|nr:YnbE family lipoprotein [Hyphomonadaceae bacterium]